MIWVQKIFWFWVFFSRQTAKAIETRLQQIQAGNCRKFGWEVL